MKQEDTDERSALVVLPQSAWTSDNPLLENVPAIPTLSQAMTLIESQLPTHAKPSSREEAVVCRMAETFVSNAILARVLIIILTLVRRSYGIRDLRLPEYRDFAFSTRAFLHPNPLSREQIPSGCGVVPRARPHGLVLAVPACTGRHSIASIVESVVGTGSREVIVPADAGFNTYRQLRALRINWPVGGKLQGLGRAFIGAIDSTFDTHYNKLAKTPLFVERDVLPSMCALGVASNLGLLIVDRINVEDTSSRYAEATWNALAQFTRTTGIPVLSLPTTGAAALSLSRLHGASDDLASSGVTEMTICRDAADPYWVAVCRAQFDASLRVAGVRSMPSWFPQAAHDLALGHPGLLSIALVGVSLHFLAFNVTKLTAEMFLKYGQQETALHRPHVDAVRMIRQGGRFTTSSLTRHSDWLSFDELASTHPTPELR
ncbi:hypothetical protein ACVK00_000248 [Burkholderia sp. PvR073]|uniref:hypothetical protein n=1 Tax=Burkholderia ambifaria TaxID=152480 RepID=UPI003397DB9A